jgi:glucoamylase
MGDAARARSYRQTAAAWSGKPGDNVDTWTFTTRGTPGDGRYFARVEGGASFDQVWNPNDDVVIFLANGGGAARERDVLDGGFLELVRLGVRSALDSFVQATLPEYDQVIRRDVPGVGAGFHRYNGDRYGYDGATGAQTDGMLWPLLSGERGHFELQAASERGFGAAEARAASAPYTAAMERMATPSSMLPEQVWNAGPNAGKPTGAATPLGWAHGEYLKLLRSRRDGAVFDRLELR